MQEKPEKGKHKLEETIERQDGAEASTSNKKLKTAPESQLAEMIRGNNARFAELQEDDTVKSEAQVIEDCKSFDDLRDKISQFLKDNPMLKISRELLSETVEIENQKLIFFSFLANRPEIANESVNIPGLTLPIPLYMYYFQQLANTMDACNAPNSDQEEEKSEKLEIHQDYFDESIPPPPMTLVEQLHPNLPVYVEHNQEENVALELVYGILGIKSKFDVFQLIDGQSVLSILTSMEWAASKKVEKVCTWCDGDIITVTIKTLNYHFDFEREVNGRSIKGAANSVLACLDTPNILDEDDKLCSVSDCIEHGSILDEAIILYRDQLLKKVAQAEAAASNTTAIVEQSK